MPITSNASALKHFTKGDQFGLFFSETGVQLRAEIVAVSIIPGRSSSRVHIELGRSWAFSSQRPGWIEIETMSPYNAPLDELVIMRDEGGLLTVSNIPAVQTLYFYREGHAQCVDPDQALSPPRKQPWQYVVSSAA
jgi:hypothetical protein